MAMLLAVSHGAVAHEPKIFDAVAVVDEFSASMRIGDLTSAGKLLAADTLIMESGGAEHSRQQYLGAHAIGDAALLKSAHIQIMQRTVRSTGDLA